MILTKTMQTTWVFQLANFAGNQLTVLFMVVFTICHPGLVSKAEAATAIAPLPDLDSQHQLAVQSDPIFDAEEFPGHLPSYKFALQIRKVALKLDVEERVIYAVTKAESRFRAQAQSRQGAVGLMQVVAHTAGLEASRVVFDSRREPTRKELTDPYTNLLLGSAYLYILGNHYLGDVDNEEIRGILVFAAYNWGPTRVRKFLRRHRPETADETITLLKRHAPKETFDYVRKVSSYMAEFDQLHQVTI
jgi:soluble lytic murein transglycosylase-like protein